MARPDAHVSSSGINEIGGENIGNGMYRFFGYCPFCEWRGHEDVPVSSETSGLREKHDRESPKCMCGERNTLH